MPPREYCCCAIPVVYAGIYTALLEQLVLGVVAGTLSIATPDIVGASTPSFAKWIFAVVCWVAAAVQVLGFVAVRQERPIFFRRYLTLHSILTLGAFGVAAAWIGISASRHSQAKSSCISSFFTSETSEADTLCNIWPWADVGIMAGLWVLFAITQTYLYVVVNGFGKVQRRDHSKYQSLLIDSSKSLSNIPLADRGAWGSRNSTENLVQPGGHARQDSVGSVATVMADKVQGYSDNNYSAYPPQAYTQASAPTPNAYDTQYDNSSTFNAYNAGGVGYPARSQAHPGPDAEGSFRRKTPRVQKPGSEDFNVYNNYNAYNATTYDSYGTRY